MAVRAWYPPPYLLQVYQYVRAIIKRTLHYHYRLSKRLPGTLIHLRAPRDCVRRLGSVETCLCDRIQSL